jgi:hypothetical protein
MSRSDGSSAKKVKLEDPANVDTKRKLRNKYAFSSEGSGEFTMIHAADVIPPNKKERKGRTSDAPPEQVIVELMYPSASQRER